VAIVQFSIKFGMFAGTFETLLLSLNCELHI